MDPTKDTRIKVGFYGVSPSPADGSIWGTVLGFPGAIVRLVPGSDPANTALAEIYEAAVEQSESPGAGILAARHGHRPATASSGPCLPAVTSPALTAASARAR